MSWPATSRPSWARLPEPMAFVDANGARFHVRRAEVAACFARNGDRPPRCLTFTPGPGPGQPAPL